MILETEKDKFENFLVSVERQIQPQTPYMEFLESFSKLREVKYIGDAKSRRLFYDHYHVYTISDRLTALKNALESDYYKDKPGMLSPAYCCRPEFITANLKSSKTHATKHANYDYSTENQTI
jgi:hypothetical protein